MRRRTLLFFSLTLCVILSSCTAAETPAGAYDRYAQAYDRLLQEDSFATESHEEDYSFFTFSGEEIRTTADTVSQVIKTDGEYQSISAMVREDIVDDGPARQCIGTAYIRGGWQYSEVIADGAEAERTRQSCGDDFAFRIAIEGTLMFPAKVVARQSEQSTAEGVLLSFELDPEKFFAFRFPEIEAATVFTGYRQAPLYSVLLDADGRLRRVTFGSCLIGEDGTSLMERECRIEFSRYGEVELDFPELNDEDYLDLSRPAE